MGDREFKLFDSSPEQSEKIFSLFVDKYNFINSAEGSEEPQAALGTSPAPGKLMQCLNSSREMLTYAKKIFR